MNMKRDKNPNEIAIKHDCVNPSVYNSSAELWDCACWNIFATCVWQVNRGTWILKR